MGEDGAAREDIQLHFVMARQDIIAEGANSTWPGREKKEDEDEVKINKCAR